MAEDPDTDDHWKTFAEQYRRPKDEPLGWRAWIGSDVVCNVCGCTLNTYVYKCPDCGQTDNDWRRSRLHAVGHPLRFLYYAALAVVSLPLAVLALAFFGGLLLLPVILVLDVTGALDKLDGYWALVALVIGVVIELAVIGSVKLLARSNSEQVFAAIIAGGILLILGAYWYRDKTTTTPCEAARERNHAWEIVLGVPDNLSDLTSEEQLRWHRRIESQNSQGYAEWQRDLEDVINCELTEYSGP